MHHIGAHHIGALAYCTATSRTTLVHWLCCIAPLLHRTIMHHIGAHHVGACTTLVLPHCEMPFHNVKNKHAFSARGVAFKPIPRKIRPPCRRSEAQGKPKLGKVGFPKIFF